MESLKGKIKELIVKLMPASLVHFIEQKHTSTEVFLYRNFSFSQEGEDIILNRLMDGKENGFYIDIGAHHPMRFSNTHSFYVRGWQGINIDAMPGSMHLFNKIRTKDINLEIPISNEKKLIKYYMFSDYAFNTLSEKKAKDHLKGSNAQLLQKKDISGVPLYDILDKYVPNNIEIDFMSIDVEGHELEVLKSNNWHKYKPNFLAIEVYVSFVEDIYGMDIHKYLAQLSYRLISRTPNTSIYKLTC